MKKVRNWIAVNAFLRPAPKFKRKGTPKGGSKNWKSHMEDK